MASSALLKDLLIFTRDGEWGKGETIEDSVKMSVIRGTDFSSVRYGDLSGVPTRFIPNRFAERKQLQPNDILIETAGGTKNQPTGRTVLLKSDLFENAKLPITCASFSRFLRVDTEIAEPAYVFWYLQYLYETGKMEKHQVQHTGVARFQYTNFAGTVKIPLPSLDEQKEIAHILGTLDDKIELNQQMNRTLEGIARALFKSWFIDFDPVRAKLDGRQPSGMDAETAILFPDAFEDSAIGSIPKGWRASNLEEIAEVVMGASPKGDTYNEEGIGTPLVNGPVEFGDYFVVKRKWTTAPTRLSQAGDLIFCVRGSTTGRRVIADDVFCLGRGVCAIRARLQRQPFINQLINTEIERLLAKTTGSVFPNLGSKDIKEFQIVIPSKDLIERYCKTGFDLTNQTYAHVRESATLASLRDTLLPKLLSGEIRVKEAAQALEAVA